MASPGFAGAAPGMLESDKAHVLSGSYAYFAIPPLVCLHDAEDLRAARERPLVVAFVTANSRQTGAIESGFIPVRP